MKRLFRKLKPALVLGLGIGTPGMPAGPAGADVSVVVSDQRTEAAEEAEMKRASRPNSENTRLAQGIAAVLREYANYGPYDWVAVSDVHSGVVRLTGRVRRETQREEYERIVAEVPGVRHVFNQITLLPHSAYDDELRTATIRAFRQQPRVWQYCSGPAPQIHVLVEYGDVTLEGRVRSLSDKRFAENLVRSQVRPLDVVNNLNVVPNARTNKYSEAVFA